METIDQTLLTFLLNATWQVALVAAIASVTTYFLRRGPASHRHTVWAAALIAALVLPAVSVYQANGPAISEIAISLDGPEIPNTSAIGPGPASTSNQARRLPEAVPFSRWAAVLVLAGYILATVFAAVRFGRAWMRTLYIRQSASARTAPPTLARVWERCTHLFGAQTVDLLSSATLASPCVVGVIRPAVILSEAVWNEVSEDVLMAAIGHELVHIARRDFARNLIQELLMIPVSFHPAVWFMKRNLERTREMACDEAVTASLLERGVYARSIVHIASAIGGASSPGYTLGIFDGDILEQRVRRLLEGPGVNFRRARMKFATAITTIAVCAIGAAGFALTARAQSAFQDQMRAAGQAYNSANFKAAIDHFSTAVTLDPESKSARLFLANALMRQYYSEPTPTPSWLESARQQYQEVLARDPQNKQANSGMLALLIDQKQMTAARDFASKLAAIEPNDSNVWYTAGVVEWAIAYPDFQRAKQAAGARQEDYSIPDANLRREVRDAHLARVEEGLRMLDRALLLNADNDQAMAYINLLYRLKAGMTDNPAEAAELIATADRWVGKALEARRQRGETHPAGETTIDIEGPPPGPAGRNTMVKAPPPPPPPPSRERAQQIVSAAPPPQQAPGEFPRVGQFWQVTGPGEVKAIDLFRQLKSKGFDPAMHAGTDGAVRVVVGPFFDRASIERVKAALETAGFHPIRRWE